MTDDEKKLQTALVNLGADLRKAEEACNKGRYEEHKALYSRISLWLMSMKGDMDQIMKILAQEVE